MTIHDSYDGRRFEPQGVPPSPVGIHQQRRAHAGPFRNARTLGPPDAREDDRASPPGLGQKQMPVAERRLEASDAVSGADPPEDLRLPSFEQGGAAAGEVLQRDLGQARADETIAGREALKVNADPDFLGLVGRQGPPVPLEGDREASQGDQRERGKPLGQRSRRHSAPPGHAPRIR